MKKKQINYGFKTPVIELDQHIFGSNNYGDIINPSGQYDTFLPPFEPQARYFETQGCTVYGTHNGVEILHKFKFNEDKDFEELYNYLDAGTDPNGGGDPHKVCESIRKSGLEETPKYPFPKTLNELLNLIGKPQPQNIVNDAKKYLENYKFNHVWVLNGYENEETRIADIKDALKYGVVCVSVSAWNQSGDIYVDNGMPNNHWCVCYGWTERGWKIFDTYDHSTKIYSFDSRIDFAKLLFLQKGNFKQENNWFLIDILKKVLEACKSILQLDKQILDVKVKEYVKPEPPKVETPIVTKADLFVQALKNSIGHDLSPKNLAPQELSCAEGMSNILNSIFPDFPKDVTYTPDLFKKLKAYPQYFKPTLTPSKGCVIISPTVKDTHGHVGGMISATEIVSNSSKTGTIESNYTFDQWVNKYKIENGLRVYIFEIIS